jgi:polyisoprenoid-binding protein YceI
MEPMNKALIVATSALLISLSPAQAQGASYAIDPTHTFVTFEVLHIGTSTSRGRFDRKSGSITMDRSAKSGRVDITIETASINTGVAAFDKNLQGKDFFDSETHATARFVGDRFTFVGDKVSEVAGQFTLLGKTHPVTLKAVRFNCFEHSRLKRELCGGDFETTIQRSQWGMGYGIPGIPDAVRLVIQVEAIRQ